MTQEIKLTKGYVALIDDRDFSLVNRYKWCAEVHPNVVYAKNGTLVMKMHVFIMQPTPGFLINHIDRNGLNNTRDNLEIVTRSENTRLALKREGTKSIYKGVYKDRSKFRAMICICGKNYSLGSFKTETEAAQAYNDAGERLLGRGNFIMNNLE